eukprot:6209458-Pyramimonas_sp.AAC.1
MVPQREAALGMGPKLPSRVFMWVSSAVSGLNPTDKAYSHDGPIGRRKRGYALVTDQSDAP